MVAERVIDLKKGLTEEVLSRSISITTFGTDMLVPWIKARVQRRHGRLEGILQDFQRTYVAGTRENQELSLHFRDPEALREALNTYLTKSSSWQIKQQEAGPQTR